MSGPQRMVRPAAGCHSGAVMFANRDGKLVEKGRYPKTGRRGPYAYGTCRWRGRLKIPKHAHPLVRRLFAEMNHQLTTMTEIASEAGLRRCSIGEWGTKMTPRVSDLEAAFNVLGLRLVVEKIPE